MAATQPKPGDTWTYVGDSPIGTDLDVQPGQTFTVREVVPADEAGAHDDSEDAVVLVWSEPAVGLDEDGRPALVEKERAWSVGVDQFHAEFKKGEVEV